MPELTEADFKRSRRVTRAETEMFRQAIERKLGVSRPPRMGRPPKHPDEKFVPISWRTPPEIMDWLVDQARNAGVGGYQTFLSLLLRGMMRYKVVREKYGVTLTLPNSDHVIVIASGESPGRETHSKVAERAAPRYSAKRTKKARR